MAEATSPSTILQAALLRLGAEKMSGVEVPDGTIDMYFAPSNLGPPFSTISVLEFKSSSAATDLSITEVALKYLRFLGSVHKALNAAVANSVAEYRGKYTDLTIPDVRVEATRSIIVLSRDYGVTPRAKEALRNIGVTLLFPSDVSGVSTDEGWSEILRPIPAADINPADD